MSADALSDLLKTVRLTGAAYFEIRARDPWAVASPPRELILPRIIGKVISLMHARPAHDWAIDELAREAGTSRSVLADRFVKLIGIPPIQYLAKWRMQIASELMTSAKGNLASIAAEVGYESEASFSRAFKKVVGVSPSAWRRRARPGE
jgi:AraC-like DNA-binding protein